MGEQETSRTAVILAAIQRQLELRRQLFDRADDLGEVAVTVKLDAGTAVVRAVVVTDLRVARRRL